MSVLLGIDIGTTATKAILLDPVEGVVAQAERSVTLHSDHPGWAEEDPGDWWANVAALCRELLPGRDIAAVGVSGMVPCVVLQDEEGHPIRRSIQQNDARATEEIVELDEELAGARVLERTGSAITQQSVAPTVRWLQRHEPEAWARTRTISGSYDSIVRQLTGERSVEANWALESGLFDLETDDWAPDILAAIDLGRPLLPPVRRPDEVVGVVRPSAAQVTGLSPGTPVVAGSADHVASAFAAGLVREGRHARQARWSRGHPLGVGFTAHRPATLPRLPPQTRTVPAERLHGHIGQLHPLVPSADGERRVARTP